MSWWRTDLVKIGTYLAGKGTGTGTVLQTPTALSHDLGTAVDTR